MAPWWQQTGTLAPPFRGDGSLALGGEGGPGRSLLVCSGQGPHMASAGSLQSQQEPAGSGQAAAGAGSAGPAREGHAGLRVMRPSWPCSPPGLAEGLGTPRPAPPQALCALLQGPLPTFWRPWQALSRIFQVSFTRPWCLLGGRQVPTMLLGGVDTSCKEGWSQAGTEISYKVSTSPASASGLSSRNNLAGAL